MIWHHLIKGFKILPVAIIIWLVINYLTCTTKANIVIWAELFESPRPSRGFWKVVSRKAGEEGHLSFSSPVLDRPAWLGGKYM